MNIKAIARRPAKVICLGEILFDYLADELGKPVSEVKSWTSYPGGAPANVACALAKLGTSAAFIGCVGKDKQGQELVSLLKSIGVDTSGVQYHENKPTRQVYVTRTKQGDRQFSGFGGKTSDQFADAYLQAHLLPRELFLNADYLVLGTLELAYPQSRAAVMGALDLALEYHLKIVIDINWRPMFWQDQQQAPSLIKDLWSYVDFLKLAKEEAQWLFNTADAGAISYHLGSVEGVIVSDGNGRVSYCLSDIEGTVDPIEVAVKDTTGAGDAFLAGFIHQLCCQSLQELNDPQAARDVFKYACAVGSLTTTNSGAISAQPTPAAVAALLNQDADNFQPKT